MGIFSLLGSVLLVRHEPHLPLPLLSTPSPLPCLQMKIQNMQVLSPLKYKAYLNPSPYLFLYRLLII